MKEYTSVQEYIDAQEGIAKERLLTVRELIISQLPGVEERISYGIIGYFLDKRIICYVGAYPKHIGMYPIHTAGEAFSKQVAAYRHGKSTAQFLHSQPLPEELIKTFVKLRRDLS